MTTATSINLRAEVLKVLRTTNLSSPHEIADEVMELITPENALDAVEQMLTDYVRHVITTQRTSSGPKVPPESIRQAGDQGRRNPVFSNGMPPATPPPSRNPSKATTIREGWQRFLTERVPVGEGRHKMFRDLTYEDMLYAAQVRRSTAENNLEWARRYDAWAALLTQYDVETFKDLPTEVQMRAVGSVA